MTKSNRAIYKPIPINAIKVDGWLEQQSSLAMKGFIGSLPLISKEVWSDVFASGQLGINQLMALAIMLPRLSGGMVRVKEIG